MSTSHAHHSAPLCFSNIDPTPLQFLWNPYIPLGKITLLASDPGLGKSALTLTLASLLSTATPLPGNPRLCRRPDLPPSVAGPSENLDPSSPSSNPPPSDLLTSPTPSPTPSVPQCPSASVPFPSPSATLFLSPEDNLADTTRPRLDALGAHLPLIHSLKDFPPLYPTPDFPNPLSHLRKALHSIPHLKLLVIDPITYYLGPTDRKLAPQKNSSDRSTLHALARLAEELNIAILLTTRLSKRIPPRASRRALVQLFGSLAFTAIARSVILLTQHPTTPNRRLFVPIKSNLTALPPPLSLTFQSPSPPSPNRNPNRNRNRNDLVPNTEGPSENPKASPSQLPDYQITQLPDSPFPSLQFDPTPIDPESLLDLLSDPKPEKPDPCLISAQQFLQAALSEGPTKVTVITKAAGDQQIAQRTLERAKATLAIRAVKHPKLRKWYWSLPDDNRPFRTGPYDHFPAGED